MDTNLFWILAIALAAVYFTARRLGKRKAASASQVRDLPEDAVFLDVRTKGEFESGAHPKARNIPLDSLPSRLAELSQDKPIVVYCASGARASHAAQILGRAGFKDVVNAGGIGDVMGM